MVRFGALVFLTAVAPLTAQTVIKGHHLGETASEFLQADHDVQKRLDSCHKDAPQVLTSAQVHALPDEEITLISMNYPDYPNRKKLEQRASSGGVSSTDHRFTGQKVFCDAAISVLENGKDGIFLSDVYFPIASLSTTQFLFWKGRLSQIDLKLPSATYDEVSSDFSSRTNSKPSDNLVPMQNAMGATWKNRLAVWNTSELYAVLTDDRNPAEPDLRFTIESAEAHAARAAAEKARHTSPLDK